MNELSKIERSLLLHLRDVGPMPIDWLKPKYRIAVPRLRKLRLLWRRGDFAQLTNLGRSCVPQQ